VNVAVITLESMTTPPPAQQEHSSGDGAGSVTLGFVLLLVSIVLPLWLISMALWPAQGNDFGGDGMAMAALGVVFLAVSPLTAAAGLFLIHRHDRRLTLRLIAWCTAMPTIAVCLILVVGFVLEMRPKPKYDPKNYQHLLGQTLRDAEAELGKRGSVSGSGSGGGVSYRFLSYRGMEITATREGIITEVKKGRRD
jgi:hypothetical protein